MKAEPKEKHALVNKRAFTVHQMILRNLVMTADN